MVPVCRPIDDDDQTDNTASSDLRASTARRNLTRLFEETLPPDTGVAELDGLISALANLQGEDELRSGDSGGSGGPGALGLAVAHCNTVVYSCFEWYHLFFPHFVGPGMR